MTTALREYKIAAAQEREVRLDVLATVPEPRPMAAKHFRCDDCGQVCACTGDARLLPHERCGVPR